MIFLDNVTKQFVTSKKYPGFIGAIKGLFTREKVIKLAVNNISMKINDGEVVGYIGGNGAGKSTTIKMMTGILTPTSGTCMVNGINPAENRIENARNIGVVFGQRTQLWWDLPLSESFSILKEIYHISSVDYESRMEYFNEVLGINEFINSSVRTLSLGQRMRADLAAALLHNPKVLYLDEPTIGLDVVVKENIRRAIKEINKKYNTTIILTTHDMEDIEELCNRIIIIDKGTVIYDGMLADLMKTYGTKCIIEIEVKEVELLQLNYNELLNISKENLSVKINKNNICFTFNKNAISVIDIISYVMKRGTIKDFKVKETELSEIVKEIYKKGMVGEVLC
ncbi:ABC transporter ATP-binding protein [Inconstantimicrobium mannanitabidum]|uniref:ABC transporter ATP-binding protein n=1 Tax=Inconstantimicrobium mannanitabidum TaxID=1604901 RepID=A0ACB5RH05_9CLOT|nr:ATP-binding cassette domain-containing protein [Clostridium sp. TW13]GKX68385.1 ABC transporter ATP-binding protein [Clostridium sp. TW13]